uniref:uncharacterized protein LOC122591534 n=1 Tax=Erigeron canadensis TaxID=72917 RepID=UPI001CB8A05C|nr:uncharacterized protein LOC122591534 [Erigeron canadensis]
MDFIMKLPRTKDNHNSIWVIVDRLTKSARFLPIRDDYSLERLAEIYIDDIVTKYGVPLSIVSDRDPRFTSDFWQSLQEVLEFRGSWDKHLPLIEFSSNNIYHTSIQCAPFEALYGRNCKSPLCWLDAGERSWMKLPVVQFTIDKIAVIKEKLKAAQDRQKSYADKRRKPLEFQVGDKILLKVSPWKGTSWFGKKANWRLGTSDLIRSLNVWDQ